MWWAPTAQEHENRLFGKTPEEKLARLLQIRDLQAQYPGRAPGGSGLTGLLTIDSRGWDEMQREQNEAKAIENEFAKRRAPTIKPGRMISHIYGPYGRTRTEDQAAGPGPVSTSAEPSDSGGADSPDWWLQGEPDPRDITAQTIPRIRRNLDMLPPSLRALYAERFKER
mgnify:FL=1